MNRGLTCLAVAGGAALLAVPAIPQSQKIIPPKTVYWLSAATQAGFGIPGSAAPSTSDMMRMAMGGGGSGPIRMLRLDLGSKLPPASAPASADHMLPPGMGMGASLPLRAPRKAVSPTGEDEFERPKGKLLLFWGCGETARPGQPVTIDFAKLAAGEIPANLFGGARVRVARPPSASTWPTFVEWPNAERPNGNRAVPGNASLAGAHSVKGNFAPDMPFSLQQDFMAGVTVRQAALPSGAVSLSWNGVPGATGHFAQLMGGKEERGAPTVVFWSSSEVQTFLSGLSDYVAPAEAARLIGSRQLLPPAQTSCAIPKEAIKAASGQGLLLLTSHGPEQNIVYPPRPTNPKQDWVQEWSVKARFVSRSGAILGMDGMPGMGGEADEQTEGSARAKGTCQPGAAAGIGGAVGGAMGKALGGLMGGKKRKAGEADCEP